MTMRQEASNRFGKKKEEEEKKTYQQKKPKPHRPVSRHRCEAKLPNDTQCSSDARGDRPFCREHNRKRSKPEQSATTNPSTVIPHYPSGDCELKTEGAFLQPGSAANATAQPSTEPAVMPAGSIDVGLIDPSIVYATEAKSSFEKLVRERKGKLASMKNKLTQAGAKKRPVLQYRPRKDDFIVKKSAYDTIDIALDSLLFCLGLSIKAKLEVEVNVRLLDFQLPSAEIKVAEKAKSIMNNDSFIRSDFCEKLKMIPGFVPKGRPPTIPCCFPGPVIHHQKLPLQEYFRDFPEETPSVSGEADNLESVGSEEEELVNLEEIDKGRLLGTESDDLREDLPVSDLPKMEIPSFAEAAGNVKMFFDKLTETKKDQVLNLLKERHFDQCRFSKDKAQMANVLKVSAWKLNEKRKEERRKHGGKKAEHKGKAKLPLKYCVRKAEDISTIRARTLLAYSCLLAELRDEIVFKEKQETLEKCLTLFLKPERKAIHLPYDSFYEIFKRDKAEVMEKFD